MIDDHAVPGPGLDETPVDRFRRWWSDYWFEPMPVARLDAVARVLFVGIIFMVSSPDRWALDHAEVPHSWYRPVLLARVLHLPAPTAASIGMLRTVIVVACLVGLVRRVPRLTSAVVFSGVVVWVLWAFSYGKVDHDRLTMVLALFALSITARHGPDVLARTGWSIRLVQVGFALAYPLSALVKLRTAGWGWANSAVFARAMIRRDGYIGDSLIGHPEVLRLGQWAFLFFEIFGVVLLCRNKKLRAVALTGVVAMHTFTYLAIGISFLPHTICIVAFFPLERIGEWSTGVARRAVAGIGLGRPTRSGVGDRAGDPATAGSGATAAAQGP